MPTFRRWLAVIAVAIVATLSRLQAHSTVADDAGGPDRTGWYLAVQTYSFHEHTSAVYLHNTTPGLGVLRRWPRWLAGAGGFRNSLGRWAAYGYGGYQWPLGPVRVGGILGITHHYDANHGGIVPLAGALVTLPITPRGSLDLIGIPHLRNATYTTLNVSVSWRFR
jgi:hypothetical protein